MVMGKIGTDIQEGKCTWLIVEALHHPNLSIEQGEILRKNYAKSEDVAVLTVKQIFGELELSRIFKELESSTRAILQQSLEQVADDRIVSIIQNLMTCTFGREK